MTQPSAVAVDGSNNVIVTGYSMAVGSDYDYATIKYSSAGVPLWTNRYNGPGNGDDQACAVAVDRSGNVIVTGYSTGSGGDYDFATMKYICVPSPVMTGLQLTNGTFQMRVDDVLQPGTLVIEASHGPGGLGGRSLPTPRPPMCCSTPTRMPATGRRGFTGRTNSRKGMKDEGRRQKQLVAGHEVEDGDGHAADEQGGDFAGH